MNRLGDLFRIMTILFVLAWSPSICWAVSPQEAVQRELQRTNQWLITSQHGNGWREFLQLERLEKQLAQREQVDHQELQAVLSRLQHDAPQLTHPQFTALRVALADWHDALLTLPTEATQTALIAVDGPPAVTFDQELVASRQRVIDAARDLEQFLRGGSVENLEAWKNYLEWSDLEAAIEPGVAPDASTLSKPLTKLFSGEPGLELPPFVRLRDALTGYRRLVVYRGDDATRSRFDEQLDSIANELESLSSAVESGHDLAKIAGQLSLLEQLNRDMALVNSTRQRFGQPNLIVSASASTVAQGLSEPVSRSEHISENILGTHVRGTAHLNGQLTANLVPCQDAALIELQLTGISISNTTGRRSPVTVFTRGTTQVDGRKVLRLDGHTIQAQPATACCSTKTRICGIRTDARLGRKLIERIAWKRASQQLPKAERIAAQRAQVRVARGMDQRGQQRISRSNHRIQDKVRRPLQRRNIYPQLMQLWTTHQRLHMIARQGTPQQLAASHSPPSVTEYNFVVQVHESMLLNTAVNAMGGLKLTDEHAERLIKDATGEVPEEFQLKQDEDPWSITFDVDQPVRVTFDDGMVKIAVRGRQFVRGDQVVRQTADIAATYAFEIHNGRAKLLRRGEVEVTYPNKEGDRLSLTELRNKTFLTNKFEGLFKPEFASEGLDLPADLQGLDTIKNLQLSYVSSDNGWLSLGWN